MLSLLTFAGAAGASLLYTVNLWPALGARSKNAAGVVAAALISAALWQAGVAAAWAFLAAWYGAFLLLWASQFEAGSSDLTAVRGVTATAVVVLMVQFFR